MVETYQPEIYGEIVKLVPRWKKSFGVVGDYVGKQ